MKLGTQLLAKDHYRLVVVGGGTAGCAVASKFGRMLPKNEIAVVEPSTRHLYQPGFTLAGAGLMSMEKLIHSEKSALPNGIDWLQTGLQQFEPGRNQLRLQNGQTIGYGHLVIATGVELRYDLIQGFPRGRDSLMEAPGVCSIYFPEGSLKTLALVRAFTAEQTALFTFPNAPIKCAGAPQKICYLSEENLRRQGVRKGSRVIYCTALPRPFGIQKYSDALVKIIQERGIELQTRVNLCKVEPEKQLATFDVLNEDAKPTGEQRQLKYNLLHIGPPCSPIAPLREHAKAHLNEPENTQLTDAQGFVKVDAKTLQSTAYSNVFAIGDCANTPNSKTAAAISSQLKVIRKNLPAAMRNQSPLPAEYDGYASCPLVVDRAHAILAEFNSQGPLETFPYDQSKPTWFAYWLKRYAMPPCYWWTLIRGHWEGPATMRRLFKPFKSLICGPQQQ